MGEKWDNSLLLLQLVFNIFNGNLLESRSRELFKKSLIKSLIFYANIVTISQQKLVPYSNSNFNFNGISKKFFNTQN